MGGNPGQPGLDYEWAEVVLASVKASALCPFCGENEWAPPGDLGNLFIHLTAVDLEGTTLRDGGGTGGMLVYSWACTNCGFIRLHSHAILEEKARETGTELS
jgi:hypothetical protein